MKKHNLNKLISLLSILAMLISVLPVSALAAEPGSTQPAATAAEDIIYINPMYADVITEADLVKPEDVTSSDASSEFENVPPTVNSGYEGFGDLETAAAEMRKAMVQRTASISVNYKVATDDYASDAYYTIFTEAIAHTGVPTEGDSLLWVYAGWHCSYSMSYDSEYIYLMITYTMTYYTTLEQENELTKAVNTLLNSTLDLEGKTDFEKLTAIYGYVCDNVTYDYTNLKDDTYKLKYTAYAALINKTAVCQGYALLMYRLLLEEGIDCRFIASSDHGWNIVKMADGLYYDIDSTWDADGDYPYTYYLVTNSNLESGNTHHSRRTEYTTDAFNAAYPMCQSNFPCLTAHSYDDGTVTTPAACTTDGVKTFTCTYCKGTYTEAVPATGLHTYDDGVVTTAATCTTDGVKTFTCSGCGTTYTEPIPATGHSYDGGVVTTAAACTAEGVKTFTCSGCGTTYTEPIPATGIHTYVKGVCSVCGAADPDYVPAVKVPECSVSAERGTASRKLKITGTLQDYENLADYTVTGHGLLYITASRLGDRELTVNTSGRTRVTFGAYKDDGSFCYTFRAASVSTAYVARTWISYTDASGNTLIVYSDPITISYNSLG